MLSTYFLSAGAIALLWIFSLTFAKEIDFYYKINNYVLTTGFYHTEYVATTDDCANQCSKSDTCLVFSVQNNTNPGCQLHNASISLSSMQIKNLIQFNESWNSYISNVQQRFWITPNHKVQLLNNIKTMNVSSVEACAKKCYTSESCAVFLFDSGICNFAASYNKSGGFLRHQNVNTYEKLEENSPINNFFIYGNGRLSNDIIIHSLEKVFSLQSCAARCFLKNALCKSFGHEPIAGNCVLYSSSAAKDSTLFRFSEAITHYELHYKTTKHFSVNPFTSIENSPINKMNIISLIQCAEQCLQQKEFICRSLTYAHNTCSMFNTTLEHGSIVDNDYESLYLEVKPYLHCSGFGSKPIELNEEEGVLASPGWPTFFLQNSHCEWNLSPYPGRQVFYESIYLDFPEQLCRFQNLTLSGSTYCAAKSVKNEFSLVKYVSRPNGIQLDDKGFILVYKTNYGYDQKNKFNLTRAPGEVANQNYPQYSNDSKTYKWTINNPEGKIIKIIFTDFDVGNQNQREGRPFVEIRNVKYRGDLTFLKNNKSSILTWMNSSSLEVKLQSSDEKPSRLRFVYLFEDRPTTKLKDCDGTWQLTEHNPSQQLTSESFNNGLLANGTCKYTFTAPHGYLSLKINDLDLGEWSILYNQCELGQMSIQDSEDAEIILQLCGKGAKEEYISKSGTIIITVHIAEKAMFRYRGFNITVAHHENSSPKTHIPSTITETASSTSPSTLSSTKKLTFSQTTAHLIPTTTSQLELGTRKSTVEKLYVKDHTIQAIPAIQNGNMNALVHEGNTETIIATVSVVIVIILVVTLILIFKQKQRQIMAKKASKEFTRQISQRNLIENCSSRIGAMEFDNSAYEQDPGRRESGIYDDPECERNSQFYTPMYGAVQNHCVPNKGACNNSTLY